MHRNKSEKAKIPTKKLHNSGVCDPTAKYWHMANCYLEWEFEPKNNVENQFHDPYDFWAFTDDFS